MSQRYSDLAALLEQFDWLADSLVHSISLEGNLRYDLRATLWIRAIDAQDGFAEKTVKLVLTGVSAFKLEQAAGSTAFETSQGAGIARDGEWLLLDLGGPQWFAGTDVLPDDFGSRPLSRHLTVEEVRRRGFYLEFTSFTFEVLPAAANADSDFGIIEG